MRPLRSRRGIGVLRPLLRIRRADVAAFIAGEGLLAVADPTNRDPDQRRARLRRIVLASDMVTRRPEGRQQGNAWIAALCQELGASEYLCGGTAAGNYLDKESEVYKVSQSDREFRVLEMLGTLPAVHYLRKGENKHES